MASFELRHSAMQYFPQVVLSVKCVGDIARETVKMTGTTWKNA